MANRHHSRSIVLQTLFEWDVQTSEGNDVEILDILDRNSNEFAPDEGDFSFMKDLTQGVLAKQNEIDKIIQKAAPEWPLQKISVVDRNILRVGLYELLFSERGEVPAKVAINEAIELAKTFGGESSSKFVNGVLGAVYKDIGEPGKQEGAPRKKDADIPTAEHCGVVVYSRDEEEVTRFAFVHDVFGHWTLSKKKKEDDEVAGMCAERAAQEELGLKVTLIEELGANAYVAAHPEKGKVQKKVVYFLAESPYQDLEFEKEGGLDDARWFTIGEMAHLKMYDDLEPIIEKALVMLGEKKQ